MIPRFALLVVTASLIASAASASPSVSPAAWESPIEARPPGATLDSYGAASPPEVFSVDLERASTKTAFALEPHADGMVALYGPDGSVEYVARYRIRRIQSSNGDDRTKDVLLHGRRLGPPRAPRVRAPEPWKRFRLRAGPGSVCESYLITDFAMLWRIRDDRQASREERLYGSIDYGYARNIGPRQSIGGAVFFGADGARSQAGLKFHARRWITPELSFDLAPGVILAGNEEGRSRFLGPGFAGQAGLMLRGRFGIAAQVFSIRRDTWRGEERETAWHMGFGLGAEPGIAASSAFLFVGMVSLMNKPVFRPRF